MAAGDIWRVAVKGRFGPGQDCVNVFHYKQEGFPIGDLSANNLADSWVANVQTSWLGIMYTDMRLDLLEIRQVFGGIVALDEPINEAGTRSGGDQLPPMSCPLISWRTGLIGRANRGRSYLPSCLETDQASGALNEGAIGDYTDLVPVLMTLYDDITGLVPWFRMVIWHTSDTDSPLVTGGLVRNLIATQKRRRAGSGS